MAEKSCECCGSIEVAAGARGVAQIDRKKARGRKRAKRAASSDAITCLAGRAIQKDGGGGWVCSAGLKRLGPMLVGSRRRGSCATPKRPGAKSLEVLMARRSGGRCGGVADATGERGAAQSDSKKARGQKRAKEEANGEVIIRPAVRRIQKRRRRLCRESRRRTWKQIQNGSPAAVESG